MRFVDARMIASASVTAADGEEAWPKSLSCVMDDTPWKQMGAGRRRDDENLYAAAGPEKAAVLENGCVEWAEDMGLEQYSGV